MIDICVVCTGQKASLPRLSDDHRRVLEGVLSPMLDLTQLEKYPLWICESCKNLMNTVMTFKNMALVGVSHLLFKLTELQKKNNQRVQAEKIPLLLPVKQDPDDLLQVKSYTDLPMIEERVQAEKIPLLLPVKQDPDDLLQVKSYTDLPMIEERVRGETPPLLPVKWEPDSLLQVRSYAELPLIEEFQPQDMPVEVKIERFDCEETRIEPPPAAPRESPSFPPVVHTAALNASPSQPPSRFRKLVLLRAVPGAGPTKPVEKQTDNTVTQLPKQEKRSVNPMRLKLFPIEPFGGSAVDKTKNEEKQKEIKAKPAKKKNDRKKYPTIYECGDCLYRTRDRDAIYRHKCQKTDLEAKPKKLLNRARTPGAVRRSDWNARFVCEAKTPSNNKRCSKRRPHSCPLCPATFKLRSTLYAHRRVSHRKVNNWQKEDKAEETDELTVALAALENSMQLQF